MTTPEHCLCGSFETCETCEPRLERFDAVVEADPVAPEPEGLAPTNASASPHTFAETCDSTFCWTTTCDTAIKVGLIGRLESVKRGLSERHCWYLCAHGRKPSGSGLAEVILAQGDEDTLEMARKTLARAVISHGSSAGANILGCLHSEFGPVSLESDDADAEPDERTSDDMKAAQGAPEAGLPTPAQCLARAVECLDANQSYAAEVWIKLAEVS
jgi:hypothetical protein